MPTHDPAFTEHLHGGSAPAPGPRGGRPPPPRRPPFPGVAIAVALAGSLLGAVFSALSTGDFMQHLDRQVHAIHCSFLPGAAKDVAASGCRTVMMSPYSSFFRESLWGGVPVSLWALAVFSFLAYRAALLLWRREATPGEATVLLAATGLPVAMSAAFGAVSYFLLGAACKVCIGIYAASAICFGGALAAWRATRAAPARAGARFAPALLEGTGLVLAVTLAYVLSAPRPDPAASTLGCGSLVRAEDTAGVMIPLGGSAGGTPSIEVLDPLCASCRAFDARLGASSLGERLDLKGVLFPLDSRCNWMVTETIHPGACAVSEAVLCAAGVGPEPKDPAAAQAVLRWAFARQAELLALGARDEGALRAELEREFPAIRGCLGGTLVKSKLTKSLRWAVANAIPVLTPQLFVGDARMCDEDTDLGLEYTLARMLSPEAAQERARRRAAEPPRPPPSPARDDLQAAAIAKPVEELGVGSRLPVDRPAAEPQPSAAAAPGAGAPPEPPSPPIPVEPAADEAHPAPAPAPEPPAGSGALPATANEETER